MDIQPIVEVGLMDIPGSCVLEIASNLAAQDLLSLASTCRLIADIINRDEAWRPQVEQWIAKQDPRSRIPGAAAAAVQDALGTRTTRGTAEALTALKFWPEGLWHSSNLESWGPQGVMADVVQAPDNSLVLRLQFSQVYEERPWPQSALRWFSRPVCQLKVEARAGQICEERAIIDFSSHFNTALPGHLGDWRRFELSWGGSEQTLKLFSSLTAMPNCVFKRAGVAPITSPIFTKDFPVSSPAPGIYCAVYGGHGIEVVQLDAAAADDPAPPLCPIHSVPRLEALKLTGDPNVPASKFSFVVDISQGVRGGPYDASRDDPFPLPGEPGGRPILSFSQDNGLQFVHLEERPVAAIFSRAMGQINRNRGRWEPEWVRATMVVYAWPEAAEEEEEVDKAIFGVIFEDEGEGSRHIMEFWPLRSPPPPGKTSGG